MQDFKSRITIKKIIFLLLILLIIKFIIEVKNFALLIFASFVIACSLNPLVEKLTKYMNRACATTVALVGFLAVIMGAFLPLVIILLGEVNSLVNSLPQKIDMVKDFIANSSIWGTKLSSIINFNSVSSHGSEIVSNVVEKSIAASIGVVGAFAIIFVMSMIIFYILNDKEKMKKWFLSLFPQDLRDKAREVSRNITVKVGGFVIAQSTSMLSVGLVTAIGLYILQVPYALALGLIAGILDIVPIVGPIIAAGMGLSVAYQQGWGVMIGVIAIYVIAQWISNNFIRPLIFGKFMDLHPLVILLSFLVAAEFLDVWGVILAPAMAAVLAVLFDELYVKQINNKDEVINVEVKEQKDDSNKKE